jgi:hypothetical protein
MSPTALLATLALSLLATVLVIPVLMEWRTKTRIAREMSKLGGEVLAVKRAPETEDLPEVPSGALYEVNYVNRWGREGRRRCRASWFGNVEWLRRR